MATYDDQMLEEIQTRLDIVDIVSESVNLSRKGNRYWGLCPFHQEKTASFCVTPDKNMFYCFGCHAGGDLFSFVMKRDGLEFREALEYLAGKAGIELTKTRSGKKTDHRRPVLEVNQAAVDYYHQVLSSKSGQEAREYLGRRGIKAESIKKYQLGYAPDGWTRLEEYLLKKGYSQEYLKLSGLIKRSENRNSFYDLLRRRLVFPIMHYNGDIVGLGGRVLDDSLPKYLNTPETELFSKRKVLYGLFQARDSIRQANEAIIVEGYMDCIKLQQAGISNVVASMGTALTAEQARLLQRYCERVLLLYDGDEAGQRETIRALEIMGDEGLKVSVVSLPIGEDPDDYIERYGKEEFLRYIQNNKLSNIEFKINRYLSHEKELNLESQVRTINYLRDDIEQLNSELEKDHYIKVLARKLKVEENLVYRELRKRERDKSGIKRNKSKIIRDNIKYVNYEMNERMLASMLKKPELFDFIKNRIGLEFLEGDLRALAELYEKLKINNDDFLERLGFLANQQGLGSVFARLALLMEEESLPGEMEIKRFVREVERKNEELAWKKQFYLLKDLDSEGNFHSFLRFILNLNSFLNDIQEGGKR
ncbi:MAG: DNA primase [Syntrophomonas sp.]|uniref:DNA primase n=1 Tax=Syntrophomonas sp. TaxID=2053627 RepID=UPI00262F2A3A|nr:DNA primase [Syntrophomonas sp.]MDD2510279.1 DNA primase [Syntrophomonas sp.]MDD4626458.1 DNA primase [Syntrophomonas sp.]